MSHGGLFDGYSVLNSISQAGRINWPIRFWLTPSATALSMIPTRSSLEERNPCART